MRERESMEDMYVELKLELGQCHFSSIMLAKASHKSARFKWRRNRHSIFIEEMDT